LEEWFSEADLIWKRK